MKKLKKLSLENEMKKEAEQIEKKVREDRSLDDIKVSDEMEKELFNKIQDYEYDKRHKKVVRKKKKSKLVIGALAAVLILVCGSVMTSVGSKSYWKTLRNESPVLHIDKKALLFFAHYQYYIFLKPYPLAYILIEPVNLPSL